MVSMDHATNLVSETRRKFLTFKITVVPTVIRTVGLRSPDRSRHPRDREFTMLGELGYCEKEVLGQAHLHA